MAFALIEGHPKQSYSLSLRHPPFACHAGACETRRGEERFFGALRMTGGRGRQDAGATKCYSESGRSLPYSFNLL
jgi:hypothetical protein